MYTINLLTLVLLNVLIWHILYSLLFCRQIICVISINTVDSGAAWKTAYPDQMVSLEAS